MFVAPEARLFNTIVTDLPKQAKRCWDEVLFTVLFFINDKQLYSFLHVNLKCFMNVLCLIIFCKTHIFMYTFLHSY